MGQTGGKPSDDAGAIVLEGHTGKVYETRWSHDGRCAVSAGQNGELKLWTATPPAYRAHSWRDPGPTAGAQGYRCLVTHSLTNSWVMTCDIAVDGDYVIACHGGMDNSVNLVARRDINCPHDTVNQQAAGGMDHDGYIACVRFTSPAGTGLISASGDGTCTLWDVRAGGSRVREFKGHTSDVMGVAMCPQRPERFFSCGCDGTVRLWDTRAPEAAAVYQLRDASAASEPQQGDLNGTGRGHGNFLPPLLQLPPPWWIELNRMKSVNWSTTLSPLSNIVVHWLCRCGCGPVRHACSHRRRRWAAALT
jgi:hypothetical protein